MSFWLREIAGWLLILFGLYYFYITLNILLSDQHLLFESVPLTFIGFVLFRGGIHMLKIAVAARICMRDQRSEEATQTSRSPERRTVRTATSGAR